MDKHTSKQLSSKGSKVVIDLLILFLLLFLYPIGLIVMWVVRPWRKLWHWFWTLIPVGFMMLIILLAALLPEPEIQDSGSPQEIQRQLTYQTLETTDTSNNRRQRLKVRIYSNAETREERINVLKQVARDYLDKNRMDIVFVYLDPLPELVDLHQSFGMAVYCPDRKGISWLGDEKVPVWRVDAVDRVLSEKEKTILRTWYANDRRFTDNNGIVQKEKLRSFVSQQTGIPIQEVELPYWDFHQVWLR